MADQDDKGKTPDRTEPADSTTKTDPDPKDKSQQDKPDELKTLLNDKRVQAEIDRRVTMALQKADEKTAQKIQEAMDRAKREAEELKLIEDGKVHDLYELEKRKREELEAKLSQHDRERRFNALLDKKESTDHVPMNPEMRKFYLQFGGTLDELDKGIDAFHAAMQAEIERVMNTRLKTPAPPKAPEPPASTDLAAQVRAAEAKGDWAEVLRLNNRISNELNQRLHALPTAPAPLTPPAKV